MTMNLNQIIIMGVRSGVQKFESILFEQFYNISYQLKIDSDMRHEIYVDSICDLILSIRNNSNLEIDNLEGYISTILRNKWNRRLREQINRREIFVITDPNDFYSSYSNRVEDPLSIDVWCELCQQLQLVLGQLSERCNRIVCLKYFEQRNYRYIADELGYSSETSARGAGFECLRRVKIIGKEHLAKIMNHG